MKITIAWWMVCIALAIIPVIYTYFRKPSGDYDFAIDAMLVAAVCWMLAIGLALGKLL